MHNVTGFPPSPDQEVPLRSTNGKIAKLAAAKPAGDIRSAFVLAAQLAAEAVGVATQLEKIPGIEPGQMQSVLDFWYRLADLARTAALRCVGGNQTLADATVHVHVSSDILRAEAGGDGNSSSGWAGKGGWPVTQTGDQGLLQHSQGGRRDYRAASQSERIY